MKSLSLALLCLMFYCNGRAQDSTKKWQPTLGINFTSVPTLNISGTDTSFQNALSIAPVFNIRSKGGFGVIYSPVFVSGGSHPGIFMHIITIGLEQYDNKDFDLVADYSHFFFTGNSSIPTTPITNEVILEATYKQWSLMPKLSAGFGFGTNNDVSPSTGAYDIELAWGVSHSFAWEQKDFSYNVTPSVLMNAGTNEYFSFLKLSKYISHSNQFNKIVKNPHASHSRGNTTTTTTTEQTTQKISLNNIELNLESSIEHGSFSIRPSASLYVPVSSQDNAVIGGYWELSLSYNF